MTKRIPHIATIACLALATGQGAVRATEPGWALIVNRASKPATLELSDSRGRRSVRTVAPDRAVPLRLDVKYSVRVTESDFTATIDAQPLTLAGEWGEIGSPSNPQWRAIPSLDFPVLPGLPPPREFRSIWATRWFQLLESDSRLELRSGFSTRDVEDVVNRYQHRMLRLGFDPGETIVFQPYFVELGRDPAEKRDEESRRREFGYAARGLQHRALRDAILDLVASGVEDVDSDVSPFFEQFTLFIGAEEIDAFRPAGFLESEESKKLRRELSEFKCVVHVLGRDISPEVHLFVRRVVAKALGIGQAAVVLYASYPPAAAPAGPRRLRDDILRRPGNPHERVMAEVLRSINDDPFLRTLSFSVPTIAAAEREFGEQHKPIIEVKTQNDWRYHRLSDRVEFIDTIPSMAGMDLRWRIAIECVIADLQGAEPTLQTHARLDVETKRRTLSALKYVPWTTNLSEFWIAPSEASFGRLDLESVTYKLQDRIMEVCTKDWSE